MKKYNVFGFHISLDVRRNHNRGKEADIYSHEYLLREKIMYYILLMSIACFFYYIPLVMRDKYYKVGDIAISDIFAPKTIVFRDDDTREKIIQEIVDTSQREYIFSSDTRQIYVDLLQKFMQEAIEVKKGSSKSIDYNYYEKQTGKKFPETVDKELMSYRVKDLTYLKSLWINDLTAIYNAGVYRENDYSQDTTILRYGAPFDKEFEELTNLEKDVLSVFISPNYIYDSKGTTVELEEKLKQIPEQYMQIKAGTLIASKGEVLDKRKIHILESLGIYSFKRGLIILLSTILYLIFVSSIFYTIALHLFQNEILNKNKFRGVFLILLAIFGLFWIVPLDMIYFIPLDSALFLLVFLTGKRYSSFIYTSVLAFLLPLTDYNLTLFTMYLICLSFSIFLIQKVNTRNGLIATGIQLSIFKLFLFFILSFFAKEESFNMMFESMQIMISGFFSGMIAIALLPFFERTFNILTIFQLSELGDLSHPLLRKLAMDAPGTFQHSMMVATLSENAALAIKANSVFTRVACYYHDIGKCKRPNYYVENQKNGENPHNDISPFMSTLIITSHTKDGDNMAKKYQIPKEIRDIMYEHQGTTFLAYFYNKAKAIDPNVLKEEFRYSGPKPRSKESAIIMLADSIEAAVRSLSVKTPKEVENMVRKIINGKVEDDQLSEADLTFKEIEMIVQSFLKTFSSIYHERLKYPGQKN